MFSVLCHLSWCRRILGYVWSSASSVQACANMVNASYDRMLRSGHGGHDGMTTHMGHGHMVPFFHFTPGDVLWFQDWVPLSPGGILGACIGLFLLGLIERWIAATRAIIELHWDRRWVVHIAIRFVISESVQRPAADRVVQSHGVSHSTIHSGARFFSWGIPNHSICIGLCIYDGGDVRVLLFVPSPSAHIQFLLTGRFHGRREGGFFFFSSFFYGYSSYPDR